jgi:hypothetical protein
LNSSLTAPARAVCSKDCQQIDLAMSATEHTWYRLSHIRLPSFALFPPLRFTFLGFVQNRAHFAKCSHAVLGAGDILLGKNVCIVGEV